MYFFGNLFYSIQGIFDLFDFVWLVSDVLSAFSFERAIGNL